MKFLKSIRYPDSMFKEIIVLKIDNDIVKINDNNRFHTIYNLVNNFSLFKYVITKYPDINYSKSAIEKDRDFFNYIWRYLK